MYISKLKYMCQDIKIVLGEITIFISLETLCVFQDIKLKINKMTNSIRCCELR